MIAMKLYGEPILDQKMRIVRRRMPLIKYIYISVILFLKASELDS
jgi:hypothetical protein